MNAIQGLNDNWFSDESTNYSETYRNEADELFHSPNEKGQIKCYTEPEDIPTNELEPCNYTDLRVLQDGILQLIAQNEKLKALAALGAEQVLSHHGSCPKDEEIKKLKDELHQKGIDEQTAIEECEEAEEKVEELTEQVEDLSKVVEEQRKFDNWENHPALKHKVVLDEDFYLQHTDDSGYLLKHDDWVDYIQKVDCMTKFIAGDGGMQDQVEEHLKQTYSTEFIKGNTETWQEIGLFEDEI
tara:strand:+ start:105 stop:830 length:726 start_codon:yes stop_codon:yes gene_type:complete